MDGELFYAATQTGTKSFTPQEVRKTRATEYQVAKEEDNVRTLDLNEQLVHNKATTFFMRVRGDAMIGAGIFSGDLIVVDRSAKVSNGRVIIALLNGEMLIRRFEKNLNRIRLLPDTPKLSPIDVDLSAAEFSIWGVVTFVIHEP
jgi:DNA polymerase V